MTKYELNKVYNYTVSINVQLKSSDGKVIHHTMTKDEIETIFRDGRAISPIMERLIGHEFSLEHRPSKGYDLLNDEKTFEVKNFTKSCNIRPSSMVGSGRKFNKEVFTNTVSQNNYIICSVSSFPNVSVIFKEGKELLNKYPNGIIKKSEHDVLFKQNS